MPTAPTRAKRDGLPCGIHALHHLQAISLYPPSQLDVGCYARDLRVEDLGYHDAMARVGHNLRLGGYAFGRRGDASGAPGSFVLRLFVLENVLLSARNEFGADVRFLTPWLVWIDSVTTSAWRAGGKEARGVERGGLPARDLSLR